jgi:hypothetical protein
MAPQTFGARFLTEFRRLGGSTEGWPERTLAAVAAADRRTFIAALQGRRSLLDAEMLVAAHTAEPEAVAKRAAARAVDKRRQEDLGPLLGA